VKRLIPLLLALALGVSGCETRKETDTSTSGRLEVGRQFIAAGAYDRASAYLRQLSKELPGNDDVHMLLGLAYLGLENPSAAAQSFQTALKINDDNEDASLNLSYSFILLGKYANARSVLEDVLDRGSYAYMERVEVNIGLAWMEQGNCTKARVHFDKALLLDPTFVTAHFNSGKCWLKSKNYPAATASFQKAVDFCPGCVDPLLELARARYAAGEKKEAVAGLEKILRGKIDSQSAERTKKLLNELRR
jgi:Tfp pilus assembly protein PilF